MKNESNESENQVKSPEKCSREEYIKQLQQSQQDYNTLGPTTFELLYPNDEDINAGIEHLNRRNNNIDN